MVNENYTQIFSLQAGKFYTVRFQYATRPKLSHPFSSYAMVGYWNGGQILDITATNANVNTYLGQVEAVEGINTFIIGGAGT